MSAEVLTPVCEVTGLPLPIFPKEPRFIEALYINEPYEAHHHFHPRREPALMSIGGKAVRNSRIQIVNHNLHTDYHQTFIGPELPINEDEIFRLTVLAAAGVVPRQALKIDKKGEWQEVELDNKTHQAVSKTIKVDQTNTLARFLAGYAVAQGIDKFVDEIRIEQFLDSRTAKDIKYEISRLMLGETLGYSIAALDLEDQHQRLKEQGLITAAKPDTFYSVAKKIIRMKHLDYFSNLAYDNLAAI